MCFVIPSAFAETRHHSHECDGRCQPGHHYGHDCDARCYEVVTITNTVTVTRTITNSVTLTVTNVVNVTCPAPDLAVSEYGLLANHAYRLKVSSDNSRWTAWGVIRSASNHNARIVIPLAMAKPLYWQLIDATPGFPVAAMPLHPSQSLDAETYLALIRGRLYRVPAAARP